MFLSAGDFFGDIILSSPVLRDTTRAKALCYCEIATISRAALYETLRHFPESQRVIRQASLKIALSRTPPPMRTPLRLLPPAAAVAAVAAAAVAVTAVAAVAAVAAAAVAAAAAATALPV